MGHTYLLNKGGAMIRCKIPPVHAQNDAIFWEEGAFWIWGQALTAIVLCGFTEGLLFDLCFLPWHEEAGIWIRKSHNSGILWDILGLQTSLSYRALRRDFGLMPLKAQLTGWWLAFGSFSCNTPGSLLWKPGSPRKAGHAVLRAGFKGVEVWSGQDCSPFMFCHFTVFPMSCSLLGRWLCTFQVEMKVRLSRNRALISWSLAPFPLIGRCLSCLSLSVFSLWAFGSCNLQDLLKDHKSLMFLVPGAHRLQPPS